MGIYEKIYQLTSFVKSIKFGSFGSGSILIKPILISNPDCISIGRGCFIRNGARLECIKAFGNERYNPLLQIGDRVNIEQNAHITCADSILIGSDTSISGEVTITDINHSYEDIVRAPKYQQFRTSGVVIGDECFIGMGARILPGVRLGKHVIVGANSVVRGGEYPDYSVLCGVPAIIVKQYNESLNCWVVGD